MMCNHQATKSYWVDDEDWSLNYGGSTGYLEYETVQTTVDIDLHRYKSSVHDAVK